MADCINDEKTLIDWVKLVLPRIMRSIVGGFIMGGGVLLFLHLTDIKSFLPLELSGLTTLLYISMGFEIVIQLLSYTIFQHVLRLARTFLFMVLLVLETSGGIINLPLESFLTLPLPSNANLVFNIDVTVVLGIFILLSTLNLAKNLLQTIQFAVKQAEKPRTLPAFK